MVHRGAEPLGYWDEPRLRGLCEVDTGVLGFWRSLLKRDLDGAQTMMVLLVQDVVAHSVASVSANGKSTVRALPAKESIWRNLLGNQVRATSFQIRDDLRNCNGWCEIEQDMNMIGDTTNGQRLAFERGTFCVEGAVDVQLNIRGN